MTKLKGLIYIAVGLFTAGLALANDSGSGASALAGAVTAACILTGVIVIVEDATKEEELN